MPHSRLLVFALILAVLAALSPAAVGAEPNGRNSGAFLDDDESRYEPFIETAARRGLILGCNPPDNDRFCPHDTVTRGEAAIMLARATPLPAPAGDHFVDDQGQASEASIEALYAAGATRGCGERRFCPQRELTRGELAALLTNTLDLDPSERLGPFVDLEGSPFAGQVAALGRLGYLEPCDPPVGRRMCPGQLVTRSEAAYALASVLALSPGSPSSVTARPALEFADGFDSLDLWDGRTPSGRNRVRLTDGGYKGAGLRVTMPAGSHYGADFRLDLEKVAGAEPEQLFFRYMLKLDPDWSPKWSGKLPGFSGVYGQSGKGGYPSRPTSPGWSARLQFFGTHSSDTRARLGYYVYHLGQVRRYGDSMMWNEAGKLKPGDWYCVEGEVRLNTPGLADGALRAWVDGTPAFDTAGIEFRRPDEPNIRIESFWFNVYYGGKPTAEEDMGLTVDEVRVDTSRIGCGAGPALDRVADGDVTGDGLDDRLWWGSCPGGTCFHLRRTTPAGIHSVQRMGDGAWFSLPAHRLGLGLGDFDGDGRDDVAYPGRCGDSHSCWRVHRSAGARLQPGEDWGGGLRLGPGATGLIVGDWDGDGLDDLAYRAICGSDSHPCWRTHRSTGKGFAEASDGGPHQVADARLPIASDVTGDGRQDLVYLAPCKKKTCWFSQAATDAGFAKPVSLGAARAAEANLAEWFDVTGDGRSDLVTARKTKKGGWRIEMRRMGKSLGKPTALAGVDAEVKSVLFRRTRGEPLQALLTTACQDGGRCVTERLLRRGRLLTVVDYHREVILKRLASQEWRIT